jgi:hypothetical protein
LPIWEEGHIPGAFDLKYPTEAKLVEIAGKDEKVVFLLWLFFPKPKLR